MASDTKMVIARNVRLSNRAPYRNTMAQGTVVDDALIAHLKEDGTSLESLMEQGLVEEVAVYVPDKGPSGTVTTTDLGLTEADLRKLSDDQLFVVGGENGGEMGHDYEDREECIAFLMCKDPPEEAAEPEEGAEDGGLGEADSSGSGDEVDEVPEASENEDSPSASDIELEATRKELEELKAKIAADADEPHVEEDGAEDGEPATEELPDFGARASALRDEILENYVRTLASDDSGVSNLQEFLESQDDDLLDHVCQEIGAPGDKKTKEEQVTFLLYFLGDSKEQEADEPEVNDG